MIDSAAIKKKLTRARIDMLAKQPFYGTLALRMQMVEMPPEIRAGMQAKGMRPTAAVDGKKIYYAPEWMDKLSHEDVKTVLAHEVSHCVFEHIGRRGLRDPNKWNAAGDYAINIILKNAGFDFQGEGGWLCDPQYADMTADQIYKMLPDMPGGGGGGGSNPGGNGNGQGQAMCDILDGETKADPALQDEWKIATAQAAAVAHRAGKLPADLQRFIDDLLNPKTDWRTQLRRFITELSKNDYSWQRPNKMMLGEHGIYLPTLYSENMGTIVVAIDTSGSITQEMLTLFASEINAIRNDVHPEKTVVIYCDAHVNHVDEFTAEDILELKMHGGGGTDFRPPFDYIEENNLAPACLLYMTDGYGPFPDAPPAYPVMWCMTTKVEPPWGERLQLELDD